MFVFRLSSLPCGEERKTGNWVVLRGSNLWRLLPLGASIQFLPSENVPADQRQNTEICKQSRERSWNTMRRGITAASRGPPLLQNDITVHTWMWYLLWGFRHFLSNSFRKCNYICYYGPRGNYSCNLFFMSIFHLEWWIIYEMSNCKLSQ